MRIDVLGVGFDSFTMEQALAEAMRLITSAGSHYVVTPNPEIVEMCRENAELMETVNAADMVLPDGIGIMYGAKLLGTPLRQRLPGADFAGCLMGRMAREGITLYLLGAKPGVAEQAARRLEQQYPGLRIVGTHDGYFQESEPVVEAIRATGAQVVFVCLGAPKQEFWMAQYGPSTGAHLLIGLGGCLDVFSGNVKRAPTVFCKLGLEWLYRLISNPSRAGRMLKLPQFMVDVFREKRT